MTAPTKAPPTDTGACGTLLGYSRHKARNEQPDQACRDAGIVRRHETREEQIARLSAHRLPLVFGQYAARDVMHEPVMAGDVSQCVACFGWRNDPRHPLVGGPVVGR